MKALKDLTFDQLLRRSLAITPVALAGVGGMAYGDAKSQPVVIVLGVVLLIVALAWVSTCAWYGFVGPVLGRGRGRNNS